ncbi:LysR family transcriptional regulator [Leekyejoonella antrihumi]|uniref:LysR family transcriptional regulator n=1 Tax=Leekyejoonella antrihumi TaxID=1660198 RepID=UPI001C973D88|nr:LysR family transcriptional regulator [Leekyejoonella antrihumi]
MPGPSFTLIQLRYFAAAAERGSMTAAARDLVVSQSAISTAVSQLEKELGVQLFLRHHARGLTLTAAGSDFLRELRSFLAHAADLEETARSAGATLVGDLSVGWFTTLAPFQLPRLVAAYEQKHPGVRVSVVEEEHAHLKQGLRDGRCELSVMYGYDLEEDLDHVVVGAAAPYVIVPAMQRWLRRKRVGLRELADEPMILLDMPHTADYFTSMMAAAGVQPAVRFRSPSYETVRALVAHGHGFALLNQRPVHDTTYDGARALALELTDDVEALEIVVAWMRGARLTRRARAFVRLAKAELGTS